MYKKPQVRTYDISSISISDDVVLTNAWSNHATWTNTSPGWNNSYHDNSSWYNGYGDYSGWVAYA